MDTEEAWPSLRSEDGTDPQATLHMWMQIVGKICLAATPLVNHWWNVPFVLTARGLATSPIPHGSRTFDMTFDFVSHELVIRTADGETRSLALAPRTVADFYADLMRTLASLGLGVAIWTTPVEVVNPIPFELDTKHASYDRAYVHRLWRVLLAVSRVLTRFRSRFVGKASPIHFFWGSFDLAHSRFSGRRAPEHGPVPNVADMVTREAYSHEVMSCGFWPGGGGFDPAIYAYAYPEPPGFDRADVGPGDAYYSTELHEWLLPYEAARVSGAPDQAILEFAESSYEAVAELGGWDRRSLERDIYIPRERAIAPPDRGRARAHRAHTS